MLEQLETHQKLPERQWSTDDFVGKIKKISGISSPKLTLYRAGNTDICTYCGKPIISGLCWVSGCCFIDGPKGLLLVTRQIFVKMQLCASLGDLKQRRKILFVFEPLLELELKVPAKHS